MRGRYFTAILVFWLVSGASVSAAPVFVDGAWLEQQLSAPKIVIVDMSDDDTQYLRFHLSGAVRLPYDVLVKERQPDNFAGSKIGLRARRAGPNAGEGEPQGRNGHKVMVRLDDAELLRVLGRLGITRDSHVVIYDDLGGLHAARLFWELERIGHPEVSVLDGGLVKWILDGRRVVNAPAPRKAVTYERRGIGRDNEAGLRDVQPALEKRSAQLLDVRTEEEYLGDPKKPRTGHIPGARLWPWDLAVDFERGFVRRDDASLRKMLAQVDAGPDRTVITYCRSGHRAAHTYLTMRALGFENVKLYANSMNEYSLALEAPIKQGKKP
ncbi:MAG: rhodanese-like domain-containing protein [Sulfuricaulis sp.]|nr:rhodanese-like domain-containing protein [Sulfuricaulis sp.]